MRTNQDETIKSIRRAGSAAATFILGMTLISIVVGRVTKSSDYYWPIMIPSIAISVLGFVARSCYICGRAGLFSTGNQRVNTPLLPQQAPSATAQ